MVAGGARKGGFVSNRRCKGLGLGESFGGQGGLGFCLARVGNCGGAFGLRGGGGALVKGIGEPRGQQFGPFRGEGLYKLERGGLRLLAAPHQKSDSGCSSCSQPSSSTCSAGGSGPCVGESGWTMHSWWIAASVASFIRARLGPRPRPPPFPCHVGLAVVGGGLGGAVLGQGPR